MFEWNLVGVYDCILGISCRHSFIHIHDAPKTSSYTKVVVLDKMRDRFLIYVKKLLKGNGLSRTVLILSKII